MKCLYNGVGYTKEEIKFVELEITEAFNYIKEVFPEVLQSIFNSLKSFIENTRVALEEKEDLSYSWIVPKEIKMPPIPTFKGLKITMIRDRI